jgi:predicted nucleic acid-binding protein
MPSFARIAIPAAGNMYLDSAIIVKLLVREPESEYFNNTLSGHALDSSELCLTEVCSALLAKERGGSITGRQRMQAMVRFKELLREDVLRLYPLDRRVLDRAAAILEACHPKIALRTLDALHVATCDLYECDALCATDQRMRDAGGQLAIKLFPGRIEEIRS